MKKLKKLIILDFYENYYLYILLNIVIQLILKSLKQLCDFIINYVIIKFKRRWM